MIGTIPLLQRYIFAEILRAFVLILLCLTVLVNIVGVFQQAAEYDLGPLQVLEILPYIVPSMMPFTIPAALLMTVSVVYGRIAWDQEITAAKAAGINVLSLLWPAFALGAILSVCCFLLTDQVIPWALGKIEVTLVQTMEDFFLDRLRHEHRFSDPRRGLHITVAGVEGRRLIDPVIRYTRGQQPPVTLRARFADIKLDLKHQQAVIRLSDAYADISDRQRVHFGGERIEVLKWENEQTRPRPRNLPVSEIESELKEADADRRAWEERQIIDKIFTLTQARFEKLNVNTTPSEVSQRSARLATEIHSRYALACSCFFFSLLGCPFAVLQARSQFLTSFSFCFGPIVAVYYPLMMGMMTQAKRGHISPIWSMWLGNALCAAAGYYVLRRVMKH